MHIKLIRVTTTPDRKAGFLERQIQWNVAMASYQGFVDSLVASNDGDDGEVVIITVWRDKESLDRFMAGSHDEIENKSGIREFYDSLVVDHLSTEESLFPSRAGHILFGEGAPGLIELSEAYRGSMILRTALTCDLFDMIGTRGSHVSYLAEQLGVTNPYLERLCHALASLGLVYIDSTNIVHLTSVAKDHLLRSSPTYLGHLILHNTRPVLWARWGGLPAELSLPDSSIHTNDHEQFLEAMSDAAHAGQAEQLLRHIDLNGHRRMLDIGGALGDYSEAILRAYPDMCADVLDLPQSRTAALERIATAGMGDRFRFIEGDYRSSLPDRDYDVALLSNVLRGETLNDAERLLANIFSLLRPGGILLLYDLFLDKPTGHCGLLATFFGLHLPDAMNPTAEHACEMLVELGFVDVTVASMPAPLIANQLLTAHVPKC